MCDWANKRLEVCAVVGFGSTNCKDTHENLSTFLLPDTNLLSVRFGPSIFNYCMRCVSTFCFIIYHDRYMLMPTQIQTGIFFTILRHLSSSVSFVSLFLFFSAKTITRYCIHIMSEAKDLDCKSSGDCFWLGSIFRYSLARSFVLHLFHFHWRSIRSVWWPKTVTQ